MAAIIAIGLVLSGLIVSVVIAGIVRIVLCQVAADRVEPQYRTDGALHLTSERMQFKCRSTEAK